MEQKRDLVTHVGTIDFEERYKVRLVEEEETFWKIYLDIVVYGYGI